jgi:hypothetical protein
VIPDVAQLMKARESDVAGYAVVLGIERHCITKRFVEAR